MHSTRPPHYRSRQAGAKSLLFVAYLVLSPPPVLRDVLCGYLLCANVTGSPRMGELLGEITTMTFYHQKRYVDCRLVEPHNLDPSAVGGGLSTSSPGVLFSAN